jgi:transposase
LYRREPTFNADTYGAFLEDIARQFRRPGALLIQDNASYHKDQTIWSWFKANRHWLEVYPLPPYSPEFNAAEPLWKHTRKSGTHNRYFPSEEELWGTLTRVFGEIQSCPATIRGYLHPFC